MNNSADARPDADETSPFEPALIAALTEAQEKAPSYGRLVELRGLIRSLYTRLPPGAKAQHAKAVQDAVSRQDRGVNGGPVFEKVTRLFDESEQRTWLAQEVCAAVGGDNKPVLNVLSYLVRTNRIQRIERGRYLVPEYGTMIVTSDDLGGEPARYETD